jgi:hypothetical protein
MSNSRNAKSKAPKGKPSATGREGSGLRDVNDPTREDGIADNYINENGQPDANVHQRHVNRNTDKGRDDQGKDTSSI